MTIKNTNARIAIKSELICVWSGTRPPKRKFPESLEVITHACNTRVSTPFPAGSTCRFPTSQCALRSPAH